MDWGVVVDDCSDLSRFSSNFGGAGYQKNRDGAQSILPSNLVGFATHKCRRGTTLSSIELSTISLLVIELQELIDNRFCHSRASKRSLSHTIQRDIIREVECPYGDHHTRCPLCHLYIYDLTISAAAQLSPRMTQSSDLPRLALSRLHLRGCLIRSPVHFSSFDGILRERVVCFEQRTVAELIRP